MLRNIEEIVENEIDPAYAKRAGFIFQTLEHVQPKKILEVGCGRGFYLQAMSLYDFPKEIHGIDVNKTYIAKAKKVCRDKRILLDVASIYELPYKANTFDFVLASEIMEHLTDDAKALAEIKRVLKPDGSLVVTVPNERFPFLWDPLNWLLMHLFHTHINKDRWWLAGIWADHEKLYTKEQLTGVVKSAGFTVAKVKQVLHYCWPASHFWLYAVGKNMVERLGASNFDRFNFEKNRKPSLLARIFTFPSRFDTNKHKTYMNICLWAKK